MCGLGIFRLLQPPSPITHQGAGTGIPDLTVLFCSICLGLSCPLYYTGSTHYISLLTFSSGATQRS